MQASTLKSHYTYSSSLRGQQIPEEETLDYSYQSSSSSSTSLEDDESFGVQYPTENLGTSWGSYLHSGPPTRAGAHRRLLRDAVNAEPEQKHVEGIEQKSKPQVVLVEPPAQIRSIIDTPQPTATSMPKRESLQSMGQVAEYNPHRHIKIPSSKTVTLAPKNSLLGELKKLMEAIHTSHKAIAGNGLNSDQLESLLDITQKAFSALKQLAEEPVNDTGIEVLSTGVLVDTIDYLIQVLRALVQQSQKLQQDAVSIQKAGRQLSRNQEQYFREQREIHQAIEEARIQLIRERVSLPIV